MYYKLTSEDLEIVPSAVYWLEDGELITDLATLNHLESQAGLVIDPDFKAKVATWEQDNTYLIYDFVLEPPSNPRKKPKHVLFPEQLNRGLYKEYTLSRGDRTNTTYYADYDIEQAVVSNPVVKIDYEYVRDADHFLKHVKRTFSWMLKNGQWSDDVFVDYKPMLSLKQKMKELALVRSNMIEENQGLAKELGILPEMLLLYDRYSSEVLAYKDGGSRALSDAIKNDTELAWLNEPAITFPTFRDYLVDSYLVGVIS